MSDALPAPKAAHSGLSALPYGRPVWLLKRCDDTLLGAWQTRHDAVGAAAILDGCQTDWYTPIRVRAGEVPLQDIRYYERVL